MNKSVHLLALFSIAALNAALAVWELTEDNVPVAVINLVVFAVCALAGLVLIARDDR